MLATIPFEESFNSIVVRLKEDSPLGFPTLKAYRFQFHSGSIKSVMVCFDCGYEGHVSIP